MKFDRELLSFIKRKFYRIGISKTMGDNGILSTIICPLCPSWSFLIARVKENNVLYSRVDGYFSKEEIQLIDGYS